MTLISNGRPRTLAVVDLNAQRGQHCRYKCASACHHDAPNTSDNEAFADVLGRAVSRRAFLGGLAGASMLVMAPVPAVLGASRPAAPRTSPALEASGSRRLGFEPIALSMVDQVEVPEGYAWDVLIRWGDPVLAGAPAFDPGAQTAAAQAAQFGYNADMIAFFPLPHFGAQGSGRAILAVNHEYTNPELMFAGYSADAPLDLHAEHVAIELAAHGVSLVEIREEGGRWTPVVGGHNRRITGTTEILLTGPAAGDDLLKTAADPTGTVVLGTLNNCAGGWTPWGTYLTAEENFNQYFANRKALPAGKVRDWHTRYGLPTGASERKWERIHDRFDLAKEPNEPFRFGWVVEIDPYDPSWQPRKRTALGRTKHEGAHHTLAADGRVVICAGDDERFDYVYKFVSAGRYDPAAGHRERNRDLLDEGTLYVARFDDDLTGEWLPLIHGVGPLTAANGFASQAEVLLNTRGAADLLGATKMDRPEDIERNPVTGAVYALFTNNSNRGVGSNPGPDEANPRVNNRPGHIIELWEAANDAGATAFSWSIFMLCGDPSSANPVLNNTYFAGFDESLVSPIAAPDNIMFDGAGNLWIATDGMGSPFGGVNDALYACPVEGDERGYLRQFLSVVPGAETCGPTLTPDEQTLLVAVQHPGEGGVLGGNPPPSSAFPDYDGGPPRPSVIAVRRTAPGDPRIGN
jgi:hypothetical protein